MCKITLAPELARLFHVFAIFHREKIEAVNDSTFQESSVKKIPKNA
jgi:hypothetical protein